MHWIFIWILIEKLFDQTFTTSLLNKDIWLFDYNIHCFQIKTIFSHKKEICLLSHCLSIISLQLFLKKMIIFPFSQCASIHMQIILTESKIDTHSWLQKSLQRIRLHLHKRFTSTDLSYHN